MLNYIKKENTKSILHRILSGIYGFLFVFFSSLVIILLFVTWNKTNDYRYRDHENFDMGWYDEDGTPVDIKKINSNADLYKVLPDADSAKTFFLSLKTGNAKVFLDDRLIYETELYETWFLGTTPGYVFVEAEIPAGKSGRRLHLQIINPYGDHATKIDDIYFGDGRSIISYKVRQLLAPFSLGVLMTAIGVFFVVFFFVLKGRFDNAKKWMHIGVFAAVTGVFVTMDSKLPHLIFGHSAIWHIVIEISLMMIPIPICLYLIEEFNMKKRVYPYIIIIVDIAEILINLALNIFNIKEYHQTVYLTHVIFAFVVMMGIDIVVSELLKDFRHHRYDFIGLIFLMIGGVTDIILYYTKSLAVTYIFLRIGIFGFLIFSAIQVITSVISEYENDVKGDVIKRLAYHDGLTDLYNRTSFIEAMEAMDRNIGECVLIAVFDVNNLKAVNDTLGHAVGDDLISAAATALSYGFSEAGKVYRTGGDEFVVIVTGDLIRDRFEKGLAKYEEKIKEMNLEQRKYSISVAVGAESNVISDNCSMQNILEKADAAMYENKKEMKRYGKV